MAKRALLVGIGHYETAGVLERAPYDARRIAELLEENPDGTANWEIDSSLLAYGPDSAVNGGRLSRTISNFLPQAKATDQGAHVDDLLIYFAGHAGRGDYGVELWGSDYSPDRRVTVSLNDLARRVSNARARSVTVILDCCYSGDIADVVADFSHTRSHVTFMCACAAEAPSWAHSDKGSVFSKYIREGLGENSSLRPGDITATRLWAYVEDLFPTDMGQIPIWVPPSTAVGEAVVLVTIAGSRDIHAPWQGGGPDRETLRPPSPTAVEVEPDPNGEAKLSQYDDEIELSWLSSADGTPTPWCRLRVASGERALAVTRAEPLDAFVVLTSDQGSRILRVRRSGGVISCNLPVAGMITTARFGTGVELGSLLIERLGKPSTRIDVATLAFQDGD